MLEINPTLEFLRKHSLPLTRENYLAVAYLGQVPEVDGEIEAEIPAEILRVERRIIARKDREFLRAVGARW